MVSGRLGGVVASCSDWHRATGPRTKPRRGGRTPSARSADANENCRGAGLKGEVRPKLVARALAGAPRGPGQRNGSATPGDGSGPAGCLRPRGPCGVRFGRPPAPAGPK
eukprot:9212238-Alexandrium_andersonii.AAC.1